MGEFSIKKYIKMVKENLIIIPNFQRQYIWNGEDVQKLIASYFYHLKIGSILFYRSENVIEDVLPFLLFEGSKIYSSRDYQDVLNENIKHNFYVIDGQQRLTSTVIAFSNFFNHKEVTRKYKRKFFLRIDTSSNIFGLQNLEFEPLRIGGDPDYDDFIENNLFYVSEGRARTDNIGEEGKCYIPLDILFNENINDLRNSLRSKARKIIEDSYKNHLEDFPFDSENYNIIQQKRDNWISNFVEYMISILNQNITYIEVKDNILEAIKTYEILNRSGQQISDLDIVAAKYSGNYDSDEVDCSKRLYDVINEGFRNGDNLNINSIDTKKLFEKTIEEQQNRIIGEDDIQWSFVRFLIGFDKVNGNNSKDITIPRKVTDQLLKILRYLEIRNGDNSDEKYSVSKYKSGDITGMTGENISKYLEKAIYSINWAGMFLQVRCGLKNINSLNYFWQLFVLAALKLEVEDLEDNRDKQDKIVAWYFLSRFSGRYRVDQNKRAMEDLRGLCRDLNYGEDYPILSEMLYEIKYDLSNKNIMNTKELRKEALIPKNELIEPYDKVGNFICEYIIKDGYKKQIGDKEKITISTLLYPITKMESYSLEMHHIFALDTQKSLRNPVKTIEFRLDKKNIINSPLNMIYLTSVENRNISSKMLKDYYEEMSISLVGEGSIKNENELEKFLENRYESFFVKLHNELESLLKY
jgi:predicted nucleic-acid-binding protein